MVKFDTVIVDDASVVSEADILIALKHSALRLIVVGNQKIQQSMF